MEAGLTTTAPAAPARRGLRTRARRHLGSELTRSGYALLLSSMVTSGLGLAYWFGAARLYRAEDLGQGAALVSAMLLVTSLATAGLKRGLIRFIRTAGPGGRRLIVQVYAAGVALALLFAGLFLAGVGGWVHRLDALRGGAAGPLLLLASVAIWAIFVLEDSALIGGRRATVVPVSNAAFSVGKIVALAVLLFLPISQQWSVLLSWVVPAALVAVAVNSWALRRGLRFEPTRSTTDPPTVRTVMRFTSAEYVGSVFWQGAVYLTPLLVLAQLGATANAHFYLAFQIAYAIFLISSNITDALVADAAADQSGLATKVRRASFQIAGLLVPAILVLLVGAPQIMAIFGSGYSEGVAVLRILALAGAANAVTTVFVGIAHIRQRLTIVVVLHVMMSVLTIGGALALAPSRGVVGVAEAWLVAQLAALVVGAAYTIRVELGPVAVGHAVVALASTGRQRVGAWYARRRIPDLLERLPDGLLPVHGARLLAHQHDLAVVSVGAADAEVVVRLAAGDAGRTVIAAHATSLARVQDDQRLAAVHDLVPQVLGQDPGSGWLLEAARPGCALAKVRDPGARTRAVHEALATIGSVHQASCEVVVVGADELAAWLHDPVTTLAPVVHTPLAADGLAILHRRLLEDLTGRGVTVAWCHGDPSVDNVLVAETGAVTGLIDWESSGRRLPETDLILLLLSRRTRWAGGELGDAVVDVLRNGWRADEQELLALCATPNGGLPPTTTLLLTWLHHVAANLTKTDRYRQNRWWLRRNVDQVLVALAADADPEPEATNPASVGADPTAGPVDATDPPSAPGPGRRFESLVWLARPEHLALGAAVATASAALAAWLGAPLGLRIPLVLLALLVAPALMTARHLVGLSLSSRLVLGAGAAVSAEVLLAEVLLYTGLWHPILLLILVGCATTVLAVLAPQEVGPDVELPR